LRIGINAKKDKIYYLEADGLRSININSSNSNAPTIRKNFYGFGIDPVTDLIYGLYVPSFTTSGWMFRYNPEGLVQDSLEVGIGPSQIVFN
jgi:hypothetical protein